MNRLFSFFSWARGIVSDAVHYLDSYDDSLTHVLLGTMASDDLEGFDALLRQNPDFDVGVSRIVGGDKVITFLGEAASRGQLHFVSYLLRHPHIMRAPRLQLDHFCQYLRLMQDGRFDGVFRMLIRDPNFIPKATDEGRGTFMLCAIRYGLLNAVRYMIAAGRSWPVAPMERIMPLFVGGNTESHSRIATLLCKHRAAPAFVSALMEIEVGFDLMDASELLALVVLLCDGMLKVVRVGSPSHAAGAARFFRIVSALPLELQSMICNRVYDVPKDGIAQSYIDDGLVTMAGRLVPVA
jgi:hypothetical protein